MPVIGLLPNMEMELTARLSGGSRGAFDQHIFVCNALL